MGLVRASSADAPLSELRKAFPLKATATRLTGVIATLSQSSREAHLRVYMSLCCMDVGCKQRRKMSSVIHECECAILKEEEHSLSRHDRCGHAGPVCASAASSAGPRDHHPHIFRCLWCQGLRRLQAATGLGMQLQKPARLDLRAGVVGLEGCSLCRLSSLLGGLALVGGRLGRRVARPALLNGSRKQN